MSAPDPGWLARCERFAREVIQPLHAGYDRENRFPARIHEAARAEGIVDADLPVALGGGGLDAVSAVAGSEILASVCAPSAFTLGFNRGALHPVLSAGTAEQRQVFVRDLLARRGYAALCLTEPDVSGSNVMDLQTTAERTERGWVIRGHKAMVGNGGVASLFLTAARTRVGGESAGLTFFAVPRGPGVEVGANPDKLGFRSVETPDVRFLEVEVTDDHRIGPVGSGAVVLLDTLAAIRAGGASVILGLVVGALKDALGWVGERQVYGSTLEQKSHVQLELGDLYARLLATRQLVRHVAQLRQEGRPYGLEAGIAKLHASTLAVDATAHIAHLFGWRGIMADQPIQKRFRDARQTPIFEGTSEIQRLQLYRELAARFRTESGI